MIVDTNALSSAADGDSVIVLGEYRTELRSRETARTMKAGS